MFARREKAGKYSKNNTKYDDFTIYDIHFCVIYTKENFL